MERRLCQVQQFQPAPLNHQEYMLMWKKFSTSEMHFKMTIVFPLFLLAIGIIILNNIFRENNAVRTLKPKLPTRHNQYSIQVPTHVRLFLLFLWETFVPGVVLLRSELIQEYILRRAKRWRGSRHPNSRGINRNNERTRLDEKERCRNSRKKLKRGRSKVHPNNPPLGIMYQGTIENISERVIPPKMTEWTRDTTFEKTCENVIQKKSSLGETMKTESKDATHQRILPTHSSSLPDVECQYLYE